MLDLIMATFLQSIFNDISLKRNQKLWLSEDDARNLERIKLLASFKETRFASQLNSDGAAIKMSGKNAKISAALREKGNLSYAQGDPAAALRFFNQSLQFCPADQVAELYASRSAILAEARHWHLAIGDADLGLASGYPDHQAHKLWERKSQCHMALGQADLAVAAAEAAIAALSQSKLKPAKIKSKQDQMAKLVTMAAKGLGKPVELQTQPGPVVLSEAHPKFPTFSNCVKIDFADHCGRFCVATRDIEAGELIAVEEAFAWMVDKAEAKSTCWHCLQPLLAPLPCDSCSSLLFCGHACKDAAQEYHRFECGLTELLYQANIGAWTLAFRALIQKPASFFLQNKEHFSGRDEKKGFQEDGIYRSDDIITFHSLVTHDAIPSDAPSLMMQALTALFLLRCLQFKGYLTSEPSDKLGDEECFFALLLHHFMRVTYYNTHEVVVIEDRKNVLDNSVKRIGRATNPSLALINHSCDPNYRRISRGKITLGVASKAIKKGQEITDTYCATFASANKESRHSSLAKYNFICQCRPCQENWPTLSKMSQSLSKSKGSDEAKKTLMHKEKLLKKLLMESQTRSNYSEVLDMVKAIYKDTQLLTTNPNQKLVIAENSLYQCLLSIHGTQEITDTAITQSFDNCN